MSRISKIAVGGLAAFSMTAASVPAAQAAPLPALSGVQVGGAKAPVEQVGWRRGYYGGYGYRRGPGIGGALFAGAALGLIGTAIAASARPRYYGGYGYPAYGGYSYPAYGGYYGGGYGYARPVYYGGGYGGGYGGYGYPGYGYYGGW